MRTRLVVLVLAAVASPAKAGLGQTPLSNENQKLVASDASAEDSFGWSVSISDDTAVVGAPADDDAGVASGSAYVFRWDGSTWGQEAKLVATDGASDDWFGSSVAIAGDTAIIGAYLDDDAGSNSGSAYVFRWNGSTWVEEAKLVASDAAEGDLFGWSVSVSGDIVVVGVLNDDDAGEDSGSAYIFRWNGSTWVQEQKLVASDGAQADSFGGSVSASGDIVVVGAEGASTSNAGSAYVFRWSGSAWVEEAKLLASDGAAGDFFGHAVAASGDTVVVGADLDDDAALDSGSAYIFRWDGSTWIEEAKLVASDGDVSDSFGHSVAISGDTAVVGADLDDDAGLESGSAYLFRRTGSNWVEAAKLVASDDAAGDFFGYSVSVSGDTAVVGARYDDDAGNASGSAYVFNLDRNFSRGDVNADGQLNVADPVTILSNLFGGLPLACETAADVNDDDTLDIGDAIYTLAYFFTGGTPIPAPVDCGPDPTPGTLGCLEFADCP